VKFHIIVPDMDRTELIKKIEEAAAALGVSPSTVGERAGQGGMFYQRLKDGRRTWPETAAKVVDRLDSLVRAGGAQ